MLSLIQDHILANGADTLVTQIRNFVAPFVLLATSLIAITFLFKRQMMQFLTFAIIAVAVFAIFYAPSLLSNLGKSAGESNQTLTWQ